MKILFLVATSAALLLTVNARETEQTQDTSKIYYDVSPCDITGFEAVPNAPLYKVVDADRWPNAGYFYKALRGGWLNWNGINYQISCDDNSLFLNKTFADLLGDSFIVTKSETSTDFMIIDKTTGKSTKIKLTEFKR